MTLRICGCLIFNILLLGCSDSGTDAPASESARNAASDPPAKTKEKASPQTSVVGGQGQPETPSAATGSLSGTVTFEGELPPPRIIQANKDAEICSAGEGEVQDVIVNDGRLAGAVIELTVKGKDLPDFVTPEEGFVLRQKNCRFSPRLLLAWDGAELTVYNDDKVEHNVNTGGWNLLQSPNPDPIRRKVEYSGTPFTRVTCNIHGWMESWVYIARSPFCTTSAEDGTFQIDHVPAGTKLRGTVSHSTLGKQRFKVDIVAGDTTSHDIVFRN